MRGDAMPPMQVQPGVAEEEDDESEDEGEWETFEAEDGACVCSVDTDMRARNFLVEMPFVRLH